MYKNLLLLAFTGVLSNSAFAIDRWTGFYVGGTLGNAEGDSSTEVSLGGNWSVESETFRDSFSSGISQDLSPGGTSYGAQFGYDYQFDNNIVLGIELDYNQLGLDEARQTITDVGVVQYTAINRVDADHMFSLRPKLGYVFGSTMLYATAGWAWTSVDFSAEVVSNGGYSKAGSESTTLSSGIWGAGVEYKFDVNGSIRIEYLNVKNDDANYVSAYRDGSTYVTEQYLEYFNQDLDYDMVRIGLNYRFHI